MRDTVAPGSSCPTSAATTSDSAAVPPSSTTRVGASLVSAFAAGVGSLPGADSRIGAPSRTASTPPESASGNDTPEAR